ncbi:MAG: TAXI family TRAP transporter solute-binding subunit [Alphaproteobacteria bacterium]
MKPLRLIAIGIFASAAMAAVAIAYDRVTYLRIATGSAGDSVFRAAEIIASSISQPPGAPPCDDGGRCGVPGLIAIAQSANSVLANIEAVEEGRIESALVRADIAHWAFHAEEAFFGRKPFRNLRLVASLYDERYHLVVANASSVKSVRDLKGLKVAVGAEGSATRIGAERLLAAHGVRKRDIKRSMSGSGHAADLLKAGIIDALIISAPVPSPIVKELLAEGVGRLVPFDPAAVAIMGEGRPYYRTDQIEVATYNNSHALPTLAVSAQWIVNRKVDDGLVFQATWALWHQGNRQFMDIAQLAYGSFDLQRALPAGAIWVHPGAYRYYEQHGLADLAAVSSGAGAQ